MKEAIIKAIGMAIVTVATTTINALAQENLINLSKDVLSKIKK